MMSKRRGNAGSPERAVSLEKVNGGDKARVVGPGINLQTALAAKFGKEFRINDDEIKAEFVAHLILPLDLQRGRANNEDCSSAMAQDQLQNDKSAFDCFAEANIIGNQQVGARHLDGPDNGIELVILNCDAAAKRRLDRAWVGRGGSSPANSVKEGVQALRCIKTCGGGKVRFAIYDSRAWLDLPNDAQFFAEAIVGNAV
jgi:hypothetical protein